MSAAVVPSCRKAPRDQCRPKPEFGPTPPLPTRRSYRPKRERLMHRANAASRSKVARKAAVTDRLEELLAEIKAINAWDLDYLSRKATERIDYAAWTARRLRL